MAGKPRNTPEELEEFAKTFAALKKMTTWQYRELAERAGLTPPRLSTILRSGPIPSPAVVRALGDALEERKTGARTTLLRAAGYLPDDHAGMPLTRHRGLGDLGAGACPTTTTSISMR